MLAMGTSLNPEDQVCWPRWSVGEGHVGPRPDWSPTPTKNRSRTPPTRPSTAKLDVGGRYASPTKASLLARQDTEPNAIQRRTAEIILEPDVAVAAVPRVAGGRRAARVRDATAWQARLKEACPRWCQWHGPDCEGRCSLDWGHSDGAHICRPCFEDNTVETGAAGMVPSALAPQLALHLADLSEDLPTVLARGDECAVTGSLLSAGMGATSCCGPRHTARSAGSGVAASEDFSLALVREVVPHGGLRGPHLAECTCGRRT